MQGDTVVYGRAADIHEALKYGIQTERDFSYKGFLLSILQYVHLLFP